MAEGFIQRLWNKANGHFAEIKHLAKRAEDGSLVGIWGAMSDRTHSYLPWEDNFSEGLYLAGIECEDEAEAPLGWTKWTIPSSNILLSPIKKGHSIKRLLICALKAFHLPAQSMSILTQ